MHQKQLIVSFFPCDIFTVLYTPGSALNTVGHPDKILHCKLRAWLWKTGGKSIPAITVTICINTYVHNGYRRFIF